MRIQEAAAVAAAGNVETLPQLRGLLTTILEASRFNALNGNEAEALAQYQGAVNTLKT